MTKYNDLKKILGDKLKEHEPMKNHTTFGVGGVADFYFEAETIEDLIKAVEAARKLNINYLILGSGSNVLFSDYGFPGLVIINRTKNIAFILDKSQVICDSGVLLNRLIMEATDRDLSGLENLIGIPGTVGGAVYGNVGVKDCEIGDFIKGVTLLSRGKIVRYSGKWLEPEYRITKLKKMGQENRPVILSVKLQLARSKKEDILRRIQENLKWRREKQPIGEKCAGSIFKNSGQEKEKTAGYLLDQSGAKKIKVGDAEVSGIHANFIINKDKAKAYDIRMLIEQLRDLVREKQNIVLEEEIEYLGMWR